METTDVIMIATVCIVVLIGLVLHYRSDRNRIRSRYKELDINYDRSIKSRLDLIKLNEHNIQLTKDILAMYQREFNTLGTLFNELASIVYGLKDQQSSLVTTINKLVLKEAAKKNSKSDIDIFIEKHKRSRNKRVSNEGKDEPTAPQSSSTSSQSSTSSINYSVNNLKS